MTIKEMRMTTGMSQAAFGKEYGIPLRTLQSWETGERKPANYVVALIERTILLQEIIDELKSES